MPTKIFADRDRKRRKAYVDRYRGRHGNWCPGFERAPHAAGDLTADHPVEQQDGGRPLDAPLEVLCRSCNSRKGRRTQLRRASDLRKR